MPGTDLLSRGSPAPVRAAAAAAAGAPLIALEGIRKRFPVRRSWRETLFHPRAAAFQEALAGVSLEIRKGEFFGLLGRNGAGKTTLFRILATLVLPDAGSARVSGIDVVGEPHEVRRRVVPVIPSERSLYWRLSARENLRLFAALQGLAPSDATERVERILGVVGLETAKAKQVGQFSSGMKQRLLIARALLGDPDVLLLDEPTRSLDPVTARDLRTFLREEISGRLGCTVMLATHDADEVRELCDRLGILENGRLLVVGSTDDLLHTVGCHRYRLVAATALDAELRTLQSHGVVADPRPARRLGDGWWEVEVDIPGGREAASRVVEELVGGGARVAALTRRELPLAELIETVVARAAQRGRA